MLDRSKSSDSARQMGTGKNATVSVPASLPGEVSRHAYVKRGTPIMLTVKLADGTEQRLYHHSNNLSSRWAKEKPPSFLALPYNYDTIVSAGDQPIFYVESEPEADMLIALGLVATTYGSPAAIPPYQGHLFKSRHIVAIGTESDSGYDHGNAVSFEYGESCQVHSIIATKVSGPTPEGYSLKDWLRDTEGNDQRTWLLAIARGEATFRSPPRAIGEPVDGISVVENCLGSHTEDGCVCASADVYVLGVGASGRVGSPTANDNSKSEQRRRLARIVLSNDRIAGAEPEWLVDGILPKIGTGMLYAESAGGKSFTGIDLCYAVENGLPWGGRNAKRGKAIYVAAEDSAGVCFRAACQFEFQGLETPFNIIRADQNGLDLTGNAADLDGLIADIEYARVADNVRLVIIDTFEKIAEGVDENGSSTVGQVWTNLAKIAAHFRCFVLVLHHKGKSGDTYRGSSTFKNRADVVLSIQETAGGVRRLAVEKQRNGQSGLTAEFILEPIADTQTCQLSFFADWNAGKTTHDAQKKPKDRRGRQLQSEILGALQDTWAQTGRYEMTKSELLKHSFILAFLDGSSKDAARKAVERGLTDLEGHGLISRCGTSIRLLDTNANAPDVSASCPDNSEVLLKRSA
jgi:hypothetical protein